MSASLVDHPRRHRPFVVLGALVAMVSPLLSMSPTAAVTTSTVSLSGPAVVESGRLFTLGGSASPVRPGRMVVVQRRLGTSWIEVGRMTQSSTGRYSAVTRLSSVGAFAFRAVAQSWQGAPAVTSRLWGVTSHAPYLLLTPRTSISAETVSAAGHLPGVSTRPVSVQRRSGTSWVTLVRTTTTSAGSYATSFRAPVTGSYAVRSLAPQVTIAGTVRPQYVSDIKTLSVVAQSASLSVPATLVEGATGTATLVFGPARAGRPVALQVLRSGVWTTVATGQQSGTGAASLTVTAGTPGSYSYRAWTAASAGAPAFASATRTLTVTAALTSPVTNVQAAPNSTSISLSWTNPPEASFTGVMIRRAAGQVPPASASSGSAVIDGPSSQTSLTDTGLTSGQPYSYTTRGITPAPDYRVCFEGINGSVFVQECYDNQPTAGTLTPVVVTSGATTTGIDAALTAGG